MLQTEPNDINNYWLIIDDDHLQKVDEVVEFCVLSVGLHRRKKVIFLRGDTMPCSAWHLNTEMDS